MSRNPQQADLSGYAIRALRRETGLSADRFGRMIGASPASVFRWETSEEATPRMDPLPHSLLLLLRAALAQPEEKRGLFLDQLHASVRRGGSLGTLWALSLLLRTALPLMSRDSA